MRKLRVLAASDLQGNPELSKRLADKAEKENADLVVLCGDIMGHDEPRGMIKPFKDKNQKVLILPGNWDSFATTDFLAKMYGVSNIHGYSAIYEGVGFFGAGSASTAIGPRSGITESELKKTLKKAHEGLKGIEKKVMLTHMHPSGGISESVGFDGSDAITDALAEFKPDFLLHGHIHEMFGVEEKIGNTRVINLGPEGRILEI